MLLGNICSSKVMLVSYQGWEVSLLVKEANCIVMVNSKHVALIITS